MGGSNDSNNLVKLTAKEHFLCHKLLHWNCPDNRSLAKAYSTMCLVRNSKQKRYGPSAKDVQYAKEIASLARKGETKSVEAIQKRTQTRRNRGNYSRTEESVRKGIETRKKNGTNSYGPFTEEHRKKLSDRKKKPVEMYTLSLEFLQVFDSASEAAKYVGGTVSSISKVARQGLGEYKNKKWKYVD